MEPNNTPIRLSDDAFGDFTKIIGEIKELSNIVKDESLQLQERIEAYEDIISSEIGDTAMLRAKNIERQYFYQVRTPMKTTVMMQIPEESIQTFSLEHMVRLLTKSMMISGTRPL